ncbi:MAG: glycosyltransferase family 87 protein [Acidobacteriota bacterium]
MFWWGSFIAFIAMIVIGYIEYRMGFPKPHYSPLGGSRYDDLTEFIPDFRFLHTAAFFKNPYTSSLSYPPFGAVLFAIVYAFGKPVAVYLATAIIWLTASVWMVRRHLIRQHISPITATLFPITTALFSFPIAGLIQRGNIELYLWIFAALGTWAFLNNKDDAAALLWSLAAATKLYPIVFLVLLLPRRKFRAFALGVISFVVVSTLSLWYLGPTIPIALRGSLANVFIYQGVRTAEFGIHELSANHSIFGLTKIFAVIISVPSAKLTPFYYGLAAIVFAVIFFRRLANMPIANQLLAVSVFMVMLPPISYFYTLVNLYAPAIVLFFVAIRAERAHVEIRGLRTSVFLLIPLFGSFMLFTFPRVLLFGGLVQASLLILLFLWSATYPFAEPAQPTAIPPGTTPQVDFA